MGGTTWHWLGTCLRLVPDDARAVNHKASCITCHGDSSAAPNDVKVRYGTQNGFGFKEGEVAGIISVRLPARSFWDVALNVVGIWQLVMILAAFVIAMAFMRFAVVRRLKRLTEATQQISLGKPGELSAGKINREATTSATSWRSPPSACASRSTWRSSA